MSAERVRHYVELGAAVLSLMVAGIAGYYRLEARVTVAEDQVKHEQRGYEMFQGALGERLTRIERSSDEVNRKIDDLTRLVYERTSNETHNRGGR